MTDLDSYNGAQGTGLLVSVRNAAEALAALEGGANVIDVKEPARGALGAADAVVIDAVVDAVRGRATVTAALGELVDLMQGSVPSMCGGISLFKIGLAGCRSLPHWAALWRDTIATLSPQEPARPQPVAVVYADWQLASAPPPEEVFMAAVEAGCPALLVDTWNKSAGSLFDHWPEEQVATFVECNRASRMIAVLAGSLAGDSFEAAVRLRPDFVGVRTAACDSGRLGAVSADRVRSLKQSLAATMANDRRANLPELGDTAMVSSRNERRIR